MGLWKEIMQGFNGFIKEIVFKVGVGNRVKFWKDVWCSNLPLMREFPLLFSIAVDKDALVSDYLDRVSGNIHWNVIFWRYFNDWEMENVVAFYQVLYDSKISIGENDSLGWCLGSKGLFSVKSFYYSL